MGTGKSTVGRALAESRRLGFVDTDAMIVQRNGPISEIFANRGEEVFREMEHSAAIELAQLTGVVIATGGRTLLDERNADALATTGNIFCLTATVDTLTDRLLGHAERSKRPLLDCEDPRQRIEDLLSERAEGYAQFTQIDTTSRTVEQIVELINNALDEQ